MMPKASLATKLGRKIRRTQGRVHRAYLRTIGKTRDSVLFFALHRGGSTVVNRAIEDAIGLKHVDYAKQFFAGEKPEIVFEEKGHLYAPVRVTVTGGGPFGEVFRSMLAPGFLETRTSVVMIRDPRDVLVSAYHYFGKSHPFSKNPDTAANQQAGRARIQSKTIDQYALDNAGKQLENLETVAQILDRSRRSQLLKFETMVEDFPLFAHQLRALVPLPDTTLDMLCSATRPREGIALTDHKRSGKTGGFRDALLPETVDEINTKLGPVLEMFGYAR